MKWPAGQFTTFCESEKAMCFISSACLKGSALFFLWDHEYFYFFNVYSRNLPSHPILSKTIFPTIENVQLQFCSWLHVTKPQEKFFVQAYPSCLSNRTVFAWQCYWLSYSLLLFSVAFQLASNSFAFSISSFSGQQFPSASQLIKRDSGYLQHHS